MGNWLYFWPSYGPQNSARCRERYEDPIQWSVPGGVSLGGSWGLTKVSEFRDSLDIYWRRIFPHKPDL